MTALLANTPAEPAILFAEEIDDLMLEARNYLDGEPIANEQQAEAVSSLLNRLRRVGKDADEARKVEKQPHLDASRSVDEKWKPITSKADLAVTTCKQALAPWLQRIEDENRQIAEAAKREADRLAEIAATARREASGNLTATEDAERLLKAASAAQKDAARAGKQKAHATGGERAVGLVDVYTPILTDSVLAARHYFERQRAAFDEWLLDQAKADVRAGVRSIPGFTIKHERAAR